MKKVTIPEKMQKFYGTGIMLHPDLEMIEDLVKHIPYGKIVTIEVLCHKMSMDHDTHVTCPMRTGNFMKSIIEKRADDTSDMPFWRVIRTNHLVINSRHKELCVKKLENEGIEVKENAKGEYLVHNEHNYIHTFD